MASSISSGIGILSAGAGADALGNERPRDLASAAQQFEALMMHQMLESARGSSGSWFGSGDGDEDQASVQAMEIAQQQFAGALAAQGGLGLAKLIVSRLMNGSESGAAGASQEPAASNSTGNTGQATSTSAPLALNQ